MVSSASSSLVSQKLDSSIDIIPENREIEITPNTIAKIQKLMPKILPREASAEISWFSPPADRNRIFRLRDVSFVFKMNIEDNQKTEQRFDNMIKARNVCSLYRLGLLVIPQAKKFNVTYKNQSYSVIAEQYLNILPTDGLQEDMYFKHAKGLLETMRQIAIFVAKTGFSDVEWRNIPLLDSRRVALIDLEHMEEVSTGFFGDSKARRRGLIDCCTSEEQLDLVLAEAHKYFSNMDNSQYRPKNDIESIIGCVTIKEQLDLTLATVRKQLTNADNSQNDPNSIFDALLLGLKLRGLESGDYKAARMKEIELHHRLLQFYDKKGISEAPLQPIEVNLETLDLDLHETDTIRQPEAAKPRITYFFRWLRREEQSQVEIHTVTLAEVAQQTVAKINQHIREKPALESLKAKRNILLETSASPWREYKELGQGSWLHRIINALVDKGHLFQLVKANGHGYFIQA